MILSDRLTLDAPRKTTEGFLVASVKIARTGIQEYTGREVDPENAHGMRDRDIVRVYRPEEEVFSTDSLRSFSVLDVTVDHPPEPVTADNWKRFAVGVTGEEVARDGQFIRIPMMLKDADAIRAVEGGKREISVGYSTKLAWEAGTTQDGLQYDAKQTIIRANHVSIVGLARGGPELRIGDQKVATKLIVHDGISIEFTDQAADAYNALKAKVTSETAGRLADKAAHDTAIAALDAKLAKAEAERDAAQAKILDGAALDAAVAKRADLIATAKSISASIATDGKSDDEIVRATVAAANIAVDGKSPEYIRARFDIMAEDAKASGRVAHAISQPTAAQIGTYQATVDASRKAANGFNDWRKDN